MLAARTADDKRHGTGPLRQQAQHRLYKQISALFGPDAPHGGDAMGAAQAQICPSLRPVRGRGEQIGVDPMRHHGADMGHEVCRAVGRGNYRIHLPD